MYNILHNLYLYKYNNFTIMKYWQPTKKKNYNYLTGLTECTSGNHSKLKSDKDAVSRLYDLKVEHSNSKRCG